jgi:hypothetical protein
MIPFPTGGGSVGEAPGRATAAAPASPLAPDRFDPAHAPLTPTLFDANARVGALRGGSGAGSPEAPATARNPANAAIDLGAGSERSAFTRTATLYSGELTASLIDQRGPMKGSHTASRETAVTALEFVDRRGFFGGAASVEVDLVPQHTVIDRSSMGGHLVEQRRGGVIDENASVRVRLDRGSDGVYRASANNNQAFFVTDSESGYARRILENIKVAVRGPAGVEDTAYGARYGLF